MSNISSLIVANWTSLVSLPVVADLNKKSTDKPDAPPPKDAADKQLHPTATAADQRQASTKETARVAETGSAHLQSIEVKGADGSLITIGAAGKAIKVTENGTTWNSTDGKTFFSGDKHKVLVKEKDGTLKLVYPPKPGDAKPTPQIHGAPAPDAAVKPEQAVAMAKTTIPPEKTNGTPNPPADKPVDQAEMLKDAIAIHKAADADYKLIRWADSDAINKILQDKTDGQRQAIAAQYKTKYGVNLEDEVKKFESGSTLDKFQNILHRQDNSVEQQGASKIHEDLLESHNLINKRSQSEIEKDIRSTLASHTPEQLASMDKSYKAQYGITLQDAIAKDSSVSQVTKDMSQVYMTGKHDDTDTAKLVDIAMKAHSADAFSESMMGASDQFRANFIKNGGEQKTQEAFGQSTLGKVLDYAVGGAIIGGLIDASHQKTVEHALDYAKEGKLDAATQVQDNTGFVFNNTKGVELALAGMTDDDRKNYFAGKTLEESKKANLNPGEAKAKSYYDNLHGALANVSNDTDMVKYEDMIANNGVSSFVGSLAKDRGLLWNASAADIGKDISGMSQADWANSKQHPEQRQLLQDMLKSLNKSPAEITSLLKAYDTKLAPATYDQAAPPVSLVDQLNGLPRKIVGGGEGMAAENVADTGDTVRTVEKAFKQDPQLEDRILHPKTDDDKKLAATFQNSLKDALGSDYDNFGKPLVETGHVPLEWQINLNQKLFSTDINKMYEDVANATPQEKAKLDSDPAYKEQVLGSLSKQRQEIALQVAKQGSVKPEDTIRSAIVGWGGSSEVIADLKGIKPEDMAAVRAGYAEKYGTSFDGDVMNKLSGQDRIAAERVFAQTLNTETRVNIANQETESSRSGAGAWLSDNVFRSGTGAQADDAFNQTNRALGQQNDLQQAMANGDTALKSLSPEQTAAIQQQMQDQVNQSLKIQGQATDNHVESKHKAGEYTGDAVLAVGAVGSMILTGGADAPLIATLAVAGAGVKVGTNALMEGNDYDWSAKNVATDGVIGAVTGATAAFGPGQVAELFNIGSSAAVESASLTVTALSDAGIDGLKEGGQQVLENGAKSIIRNALASGATKLDQAAFSQLAEKAVSADLEGEAREKAVAFIAKQLQENVANRMATGVVALATAQALNAGGGAIGGGAGGLVQGSVQWDGTKSVSDNLAMIAKVTGQSALIGALAGGATTTVLAGGKSLLKTVGSVHPDAVTSLPEDLSVPRSNVPMPEAPRVEVPGAEVPRAEVPGAEVLRAEASRTEVNGEPPRIEDPHTQAPKTAGAGDITRPDAQTSPNARSEESALTADVHGATTPKSGAATPKPDAVPESPVNPLRQAKAVRTDETKVVPGDEVRTAGSTEARSPGESENKVKGEADATADQGRLRSTTDGAESSGLHAADDTVKVPDNVKVQDGLVREVSLADGGSRKFGWSTDASGQPQVNEVTTGKGADAVVMKRTGADTWSVEKPGAQPSTLQGDVKVNPDGSYTVKYTTDQRADWYQQAYKHGDPGEPLDREVTYKPDGTVTSKGANNENWTPAEGSTFSKDARYGEYWKAPDGKQTWIDGQKTVWHEQNHGIWQSKDGVLTEDLEYVKTAQTKAEMITSPLEWTNTNGEKLIAHPGDYKVYEADGKGFYVVHGDSFRESYAAVPDADGSFVKKGITKASVLQGPTTVETKAGPTTGEAGDYLVTGRDGEKYIVPKNDFESLYKQSESQPEKSEPFQLPQVTGSAIQRPDGVTEMPWEHGKVMWDTKNGAVTITNELDGSSKSFSESTVNAAGVRFRWNNGAEERITPAGLRMVHTPDMPDNQFKAEDGAIFTDATKSGAVPTGDNSPTKFQDQMSAEDRINSFTGVKAGQAVGDTSSNTFRQTTAGLEKTDSQGNVSLLDSRGRVWEKSGDGWTNENGSYHVDEQGQHWTWKDGTSDWVDREDRAWHHTEDMPKGSWTSDDGAKYQEGTWQYTARTKDDAHSPLIYRSAALGVAAAQALPNQASAQTPQDGTDKGTGTQLGDRSGAQSGHERPAGQSEARVTRSGESDAPVKAPEEKPQAVAPEVAAERARLAGLEKPVPPTQELDQAEVDKLWDQQAKADGVFKFQKGYYEANVAQVDAAANPNGLIFSSSEKAIKLADDLQLPGGQVIKAGTELPNGVQLSPGTVQVEADGSRVLTGVKLTTPADGVRLADGTTLKSTSVADMHVQGGADAKPGDWIVQRASTDDAGNPRVDTYAQNDATKNKKWLPVEGKPGVFAPNNGTAGPVEMVQIPDNMRVKFMASYGEDVSNKGPAYLVKSGDGHYIITQRDLRETYVGADGAATGRMNNILKDASAAAGEEVPRAVKPVPPTQELDQAAVDNLWNQQAKADGVFKFQKGYYEANVAQVDAAANPNGVIFSSSEKAIKLADDLKLPGGQVIKAGTELPNGVQLSAGTVQLNPDGSRVLTGVKLTTPADGVRLADGTTLNSTSVADMHVQGGADAKPGDWIIQRASTDDAGNPRVDTYAQNDATKNKKWLPVEGKPGVFAPNNGTAGPVEMVQIPDNMRVKFMASYGEDVSNKGPAYLVKSGDGHYIITQRDLRETYVGADGAATGRMNSILKDATAAAGEEVPRALKPVPPTQELDKAAVDNLWNQQAKADGVFKFQKGYYEANVAKVDAAANPNGIIFSSSEKAIKLADDLKLPNGQVIKAGTELPNGVQLSPGTVKVEADGSRVLTGVKLMTPADGVRLADGTTLSSTDVSNMHLQGGADAKPGDWIVQRPSTDDAGNPRVDTYAQSDAVKNKKWLSVEGKPGVFAPNNGTAGPVEMVQIPDNMRVKFQASYGEDVTNKGPAYLVKDGDGHYIITQRDLRETYVGADGASTGRMNNILKDASATAGEEVPRAVRPVPPTQELDQAAVDNLWNQQAKTDGVFKFQKGYYEANVAQVDTAANPNGIIFSSSEKAIKLADDLKLPNGQVIKAGTDLPNGVQLSPGAVQVEADGSRVLTGVKLTTPADGVRLADGTTLNSTDVSSMHLQGGADAKPGDWIIQRASTDDAGNPRVDTYAQNDATKNKKWLPVEGKPGVFAPNNGTAGPVEMVQIPDNMRVKFMASYGEDVSNKGPAYLVKSGDGHYIITQRDLRETYVGADGAATGRMNNILKDASAAAGEEVPRALKPVPPTQELDKAAVDNLWNQQAKADGVYKFQKGYYEANVAQVDAAANPNGVIFSSSEKAIKLADDVKLPGGQILKAGTELPNGVQLSPGTVQVEADGSRVLTGVKLTTPADGVHLADGTTLKSADVQSMHVRDGADAKPGDWIIQRASTDDAGNPRVDTYAQSDATKNKKWLPVDGKPGVFAPNNGTAGPVEMVQIPDNMRVKFMASYGEDVSNKGPAYLVKSGDGHYIITQRDLRETYVGTDAASNSRMDNILKDASAAAGSEVPRATDPATLARDTADKPAVAAKLETVAPPESSFPFHVDVETKPLEYIKTTTVKAEMVTEDGFKWINHDAAPGHQEQIANKGDYKITPPGGQMYVADGAFFKSAYHDMPGYPGQYAKSVTISAQKLEGPATVNNPTQGVTSGGEGDYLVTDAKNNQYIVPKASFDAQYAPRDVARHGTIEPMNLPRETSAAQSIGDGVTHSTWAKGDIIHNAKENTVFVNNTETGEYQYYRDGRMTEEKRVSDSPEGKKVTVLRYPYEDVDSVSRLPSPQEYNTALLTTEYKGRTLASVKDEALSMPDTLKDPTIDQAERLRVQQAAVEDRWNKLVSGEDGTAKELDLGPPKQEKKARILMGLTGSGKTTAGMADLKGQGYMVPESDELKPYFPEYKGGVGANALRNESNNLNDKLLERAVKGGYNFVLPGVGTNAEWMEQTIKELHEAGWKVDLVFVDIPPAESMTRVVSRFKTQGRFVDPGFLVTHGNVPAQNYRKVVDDMFVNGSGLDSYKHVWNYGKTPLTLEEGKIEGPASGN